MGFPDFLPESPPAGVVQLSQDVIGQNDGWGRGTAVIATEAAEAEGEYEEPLLSLGGVVGGVLAPKEDAKVVALGALKGRARCLVDAS